MSSSLETYFLKLWKMCSDITGTFPEPVTEHVFHPTRKWRWDMAWVEDKVAIELEGGIFTKGRTGHSSVTGICRDMEKANAATLLGWKILRYHSKDLEKRPRQVIEEIVLLLSQDGAHSVAKS